MSKFYYKIGLLLPLFLVVACTQRPAPISMKGSQVYSREASGINSSNNSTNNSYTANSVSSVDEITQSSAKVESIGVSDLAPPTVVKPTTVINKKPVMVENIVANSEPSSPVNSVVATQPTRTLTPTIVKKRTSVQTVNLWTNAPRDISEQ